MDNLRILVYDLLTEVKTFVYWSESGLFTSHSIRPWYELWQWLKAWTLEVYYERPQSINKKCCWSGEHKYNPSTINCTIVLLLLLLLFSRATGIILSQLHSSPIHTHVSPSHLANYLTNQPNESSSLMRQWRTREVKEVQPYSFFNLSARWVYVVNATPRPLYPRERLCTHCRGGWLGPNAVLDGCGFRSADRPARSESLYRLSYPGSN